MSEPTQIEPEDIDKAENGYETLGPAYFAARRCAEGLMQGTTPEPLKKVAEKVTQDIRDAVYEYVEYSLLGDLEHNLQSHIVRMVDNSVEALLNGQEWAMQRYPFAPYQRGEEIRAAVAKHGGEPILLARIADLEKEIKRLRESLDWYTRR